MIRKKALIFGITGQDGSYLAKHLIKKNIALRVFVEGKDLLI